MAAPSDSDAYGKEHASVDLGQQFGEPRDVAVGSDIADATSQSPLAQSRGAADPIDIGPGDVKLGMR